MLCIFWILRYLETQPAMASHTAHLGIQVGDHQNHQSHRHHLADHREQQPARTEIIRGPQEDQETDETTCIYIYTHVYIINKYIYIHNKYIHIYIYIYATYTHFRFPSVFFYNLCLTYLFGGFRKWEVARLYWHHGCYLLDVVPSGGNQP